MKKIFGSIIDIRKGEITLTLLMLANYYIILATYYLLKPARDSLFLVEVSPEQLPFVYILTAIIAVPVVIMYSRASRKLPLNQLIYITIGIIVVNLVILRWLVQINQTWVYYLFYTWVSIYGALITSQFWLLANSVYDATQAKRIFSILGVGGIIGAFTGGEVTSLFVQTFGVSTEDLLLFCIGFLIISGILVSKIWSINVRAEIGLPETFRDKKKSTETTLKTFKNIVRSRHLLITVGIIAVTMIVTTIIDFQFKTLSYEAFSSKTELTAFLGKFYGRLNLVALLLQLVFAYRIIRFLGVGGVIMFLPIILTLGSVAMFIVPGLLLGVLLRGADGSLKYSLDKTGRELLMLPIPMELKKRTKIFMDMFVDRWFRGLAGVLLLLCTIVFQFSISQLSLVVIAFLIIWLVLVFIMRKEYVNSFRTAVEKRSINLAELRMQIIDTPTINALLKSLDGENERQVIYALEMLKSVSGTELDWPAGKLLNHNSREIRIKTLELLQIHHNSWLVNDVKRLTMDEDIGVRREAVMFLCNVSDTGQDGMMADYLSNDDARIRNAAVACLAEHGNEKDRILLNVDIIQSIFDDKSESSEEGKIQLAHVLGIVNKVEFKPFLEKLLIDKSPSVVREAIIGIGALKDQKYIPWLMERLADRNFREDARKALVCYGSDIFSTLYDYLQDDNVNDVIRSNIPRVISEYAKQESVDILVKSLETAKPQLKFSIIKALNKMRTEFPDLKFQKNTLEITLINEIKNYYELYHILHVQKNSPKTKGAILLQKALTERLGENLERVFRLLGLLYPPKDIYNAYGGIISGKRNLSANAVEFLDNFLKNNVKQYIFPILDIVSPEFIIDKGKELFKINRKSPTDVLVQLIQGEDRWLRTCAIYCTLGNNSNRLRELVEKAAHDSDTLISETANHVLSNENDKQIRQ